jgi:hypothetical protein
MQLQYATVEPRNADLDRVIVDNLDDEAAFASACRRTHRSHTTDC